MTTREMLHEIVEKHQELIRRLGISLESENAEAIATKEGAMKGTTR